jgi:hypothetical protein
MSKFRLVLLMSMLILLALFLLTFSVVDGQNNIWREYTRKITTIPCLGNPENCSPLLTPTATNTPIPMCPVEWCNNPPWPEKCHCPITYTLIAPEVNYHGR